MNLTRLGALGLVLILGAWLYLANDPETVIRLPPELQEEPDFYVEDARIEQYGADGALEYDLESVAISHFENEHLTRLSRPRLQLYEQPNPPWRARANFGYIRSQAAEKQSATDTDADSDVDAATAAQPTVVPMAGAAQDQIFLREDVRLEQAFADGTFLELKTDALYVYPDRQFAQTDRAVIIDTEMSRTTAASFEGQLDTNWIRLTSSTDQRVHIIVLPDAIK